MNKDLCIATEFSFYFSRFFLWMAGSSWSSICV